MRLALLADVRAAMPASAYKLNGVVVNENIRTFHQIEVSDERQKMRLDNDDSHVRQSAVPFSSQQCMS